MIPQFPSAKVTKLSRRRWTAVYRVLKKQEKCCYGQVKTPQHLDAAMRWRLGSTHSSPHSSSASKYSKNHLQCRISRLSPHSHSLRSKENMGNGRKSKSNYFGHQPHPCQIQVCNPEQFALQPRTAHTEHLTYFWPVSTLFLTDVSRRQKAIPFQKTKF